MKRAVPQDTNSVSFSAIDPDSAEEHPQQTLSEANRRLRTSAAMLGLALSVGAYGTVAPRQGDAASAAEPLPSDPSPNAASSGDVPTAVGAVNPSSTTLTHTVQDGQTLWKIAQLYGIDIAKLATMNGLQTNAVLSVGQVLQVPTSDQTVAVINGTTVKALPNLNTAPVVPSTTMPLAQESSSPLKPNVSVALNTLQPSVGTASAASSQTSTEGQQSPVQELKQNRDRLKQSLAELKSEESKNKAQAAAPTKAPALVSYQVSPGDTLSSIAQAHGLSATELAKLNRLDNPNMLRVNQFIQVPQTIAQIPVLQAVTPAESTSTPASTVQLPTVPSLTATQNPISPTVPTGIGGNAQQFAYSNPSRPDFRAPAGASQPVEPQSNDQYVNTLMSEINRLRDRYRARSGNSDSVAQASKPALSDSTARRVNPEFKSSRQAAALQTQSRSIRDTSTQTSLERALSNAPTQKRQVVATATPGSESYAPILRAPVGKMVSPSLPPLGGSDAYMPNAKFKGYAWPAKGVLTSGYGWRWGRMHKGIDIAAPVGTPIQAAAPGKVITAGWNDGGYGYMVEIQHSDGSVTLYAHNSRILVRVGQQVRQGQQIAAMGSTGFSTGPHSHFEVHLPGRGAVNPIAMLPSSRS